MEIPPEYRCLELSRRFFRAVGCWPCPDKLQNRSEKLYALYSAFMVTCFSGYFVILLRALKFQYETWTTVEVALPDIIALMTVTVVILKTVMIILNHRELHDVIDNINEKLNRIHLVTNEDRREILACFKHEKVVVIAYFFLAVIAFFLFLISSLMEIIKARPTDDYSVNLPLNYMIRIPQISVFVFVYIQQLIAMVFLIVMGSISDTFFSSLVFYLCGHLRIIRNQILRERKLALKACVDYHREVIRIIKKVEDIFKYFIFFIMSINSILICVGLLQVIQADQVVTPVRYGKFSIYFVVKVFQLFLYCWYGQEIMKRSLEINFALYSTNWYDYLGDRKIQDLKFMLRRTQKPIRLRSAFFVISLSTLRNVVNSGYSYFAMIRGSQK